MLDAIQILRQVVRVEHGDSALYAVELNAFFAHHENGVLTTCFNVFKLCRIPS